MPLPVIGVASLVSWPRVVSATFSWIREILKSGWTAYKRPRPVEASGPKGLVACGVIRRRKSAGAGESA